MTNIQEIDLKRPDFEATHPFARLFNFDHEKLVYFGDRSDDVKRLNELWSTWCACIGLVYFDAKAAKANAVPEGFVLVKKRNMIGNPNVDWLQAPKWAKYWLKDGHSNKYWWSSIRPVKDMDIYAFCWKGDYFAEEAPSFGFTGSWDKSLTSKKAMIEVQEPSHD